MISKALQLYLKDTWGIYREVSSGRLPLLVLQMSFNLLLTGLLTCKV